MRIAIVSDIHGNLTALEAVIADLRSAAPDRVVHGGDLADGGARPVEVLDRVRALGWRGVLGNVDEMLFRPEALEAFAGLAVQANALRAKTGVWEAVQANAAATRAALREEWLAWLSELPGELREEGFALVHARPGDCWRAPGIEVGDAELAEVYGGLRAPVVVYGHTHVPGVRRVSSGLLVANAGSVGLSFDGDARASYAVVDGGTVTIRRVEYDVEREISALAACGWPGSAWTARMLRARAAVWP